MNLDFDRLRKIYLGSGDQGLYEEKQRLLEEFIQSLPEDKRQQVIEYEKKLQEQFVGLTPEQRLAKISKLIQELLFDLTNALIDIHSIVNDSQEANKVINKAKQK
jgi:hypothetical protein